MVLYCCPSEQNQAEYNKWHNKPDIKSNIEQVDNEGSHYSLLVRRQATRLMHSPDDIFSMK